ncbi:DNA/RNA non-specific endonuclease [candidate division KSB1 bacterium]
MPFTFPAYTDTLLDRGFFIAAYNREWKIPEWIAYRIHKDILMGTAEKTDELRYDEDIPVEQQAHFSTYMKSDYDKGYMAPPETIGISNSAMSAANLLINIAPRTPRLHRYTWTYLERDVRNLVNVYQDVWVITGCLFLKGNLLKSDPETIDNYIANQVAVPTHFYKAILGRHKDDSYEAFAFLLPNQFDPIKGDMLDFNFSILELEAITGLEFFTDLPDSAETAFKGRKANIWPIK